MLHSSYIYVPISPFFLHTHIFCGLFGRWTEKHVQAGMPSCSRRFFGETCRFKHAFIVGFDGFFCLRLSPLKGRYLITSYEWPPSVNGKRHGRERQYEKHSREKNMKVTLLSFPLLFFYKGDIYIMEYKIGREIFSSPLIWWTTKPFLLSHYCAQFSCVFKSGEFPSFLSL